MNTTTSTQAHRPAPSFLKVLIRPDFNRLLRVPHFFSRNYEHSLCGGKVTLRIGAKTWDVKVEKTTKSERYKFSRGWDKFADDVGLRLREFVTCRLVGKSMFDVSIYGTTFCERQVSVLHVMNHNSSNLLDSSLELRRSPLYFEVHLKKYHQSRLSLRKKFCKAAGLLDKGSVGLEYLPQHLYQSVVLHHRPSKFMIEMAAGWPDFRKANGLVYGKTYSFEWKPRKNIIQVQEVKKTKLPS